MKLLNKILGISVSAFMILFVSSCADLAVENKNEPSQGQVITTPSDVVALVEGAWANYALYSQAYHTSPLLVQADWYTGTVGNFWVNDAGHEEGTIGVDRERVESYPNTPTTSYPTVVDFHWTYYYRALFNVNTAISILDAGDVTFSEADKLQLKATAQLLQGIIYGSVGLIFDKGYIIDEESDVLNLSFDDYETMVTAAVEKLDDAMATADAANSAGSPGVSDAIIPLLGTLDERIASAESIDWSEFKQIASTYASSFLAQAPRTTAEYDAVDWDAVLSYANDGITFDFAPYSDDNNWIPLVIFYMNNDWFRVDMKIVNKLDPNQPLYWPTTDGQNGQGEDAPEIVSEDARFGTDYIQSYDWSVFNPTRGYFKRSHVIFDRYNEFLSGVWDDPLPIMMRAQNNLLIAEAELNTNGDLGNAIEKINDTRVGRGELEPLTILSSEADIREALEYEWDIEVAITGPSTLSPWYNKRRWGQLLKGSMLHLPVPAGELGIVEQDYYTFGGGGEGSAPKINPNALKIDTENRKTFSIK
ncbi:MAG: hypothetical protein WD059_03280 [Balneolaceae bacterium]